MSSPFLFDAYEPMPGLDEDIPPRRIQALHQSWFHRPYPSALGGDVHLCLRHDYRCISAMSTVSCSSMVYSPSKQRMGHGSVPSHCSCSRLLRMSKSPSSYEAAQARNAWEDSYISPPGMMRSPYRSCSRWRSRAIRLFWGIQRKTTNSNSGIATSPHPHSDPDKIHCSCARRSCLKRG
jgi:hypothetical protein